jgi:aminopeptidase-like protein
MMIKLLSIFFTGGITGSHHFGWSIISRSRHTIHVRIDSTYSCSPDLALEDLNGVEFIIFIFERLIHAEVVTYRLDVDWNLAFTSHKLRTA